MGRRGVKLTSLEDTFRFAKCVFDAGMGTKGDSPQTIAIKIQMGAECGLPPMASIQNIAVINGRPSIWGDAMLAVCQGSGLFDLAAFKETYTSAGPGNVSTATCHVRRLPDGEEIVRSFSMKDATVAGLAGKAGPWQQYPRRMLQLRARSWALRDAFADVLRGMRATEEEIDIVDGELVVPAKTLDDLTEKMTSAPDDFHPPTSDEVAAAQDQLLEEFAVGLANAKSLDEVNEVCDGIDLAYRNGSITADQREALTGLAKDANRRLEEISTSKS